MWETSFLSPYGEELQVSCVIVQLGVREGILGGERVRRVPGLRSPKQSVPEGLEGGGVEGTNEDEQQQVQAHHDGKVVSDQPGRPLSMPGSPPKDKNTTSFTPL